MTDFFPSYYVIGINNVPLDNKSRVLAGRVNDVPDYFYLSLSLNNPLKSVLI